MVGAVISETGVLAPLAAAYRKGIVLWQEQTNAAGGLLGRPVELRVLDDGSQAGNGRALYQALIAEHKADALLGPFGSAAALVAAAEAERARRVLVNGAAPSRAVHRRAPKYVFQAAPSYGSYGIGALQLAKAAGCARLLILSRDDPASAEMAAVASETAAKMGFADVIGPLPFAARNADFKPLISQAKSAGVDAWIAFGEAPDAADTIIAFRRNGFAPPMFFSTGATQSAFITLVGRDAERSLGTVRYDPNATGPVNASFARAFSSRWGAAPSAAAAEGYAAASVLGEAVRRAGSAEQEKLRAALSTLELDTPVGSYRVNPANGEQTGMQLPVGQIIKGRVQVVWPASAKTTEPSIKCH